MAIAKNDPGYLQYKKAKSNFLKRGLFFAFLSGICYGLFSTFLTVGEGWAVWNDWWGLPLAGTAIGYALLCAVGAGLNDLFSGCWCTLIAAGRGKLMDVFRTMKTKPGAIIMCCGLIGGPVATTCYCVALITAGGIAAAITALCAAIGAILGRIFFKQKLNLRMIAGVIICFGAAVVIGGTAFLDEGTSFVGCLIAFCAALCWGIEGVVAGYGTSMIDYEIGITIRQLTSGAVNLLVLVPILCLIASSANLLEGVSGNPYGFFVGGAIASIAILWFVVSGFFSNPAYSMWYKGNSMCGAALGMTCNAMYSFWVPFFMWIVCGLILGWEGYTLSPIQWAMAVVEIFGIWMIAMNPLDIFKKKEA